jgi:hypothetical protein
MIKVAISILIAWLANLNLTAQNVIEYVEIFSYPLQATTAVPIGLKDITDSSCFVLQSRDQVFLNALAAYTRDFDKERSLKRGILRDYRVLLAIKYKDGSSGYLGANTLPLLEYNGRVFKDRNYTLYLLLNAHFNFSTIATFLEDHKVLEKIRKGD